MQVLLGIRNIQGVSNSEDTCVGFLDLGDTSNIKSDIIEWGIIFDISDFVSKVAYTLLFFWIHGHPVHGSLGSLNLQENSLILLQFDRMALSWNSYFL